MRVALGAAVLGLMLAGCGGGSSAPAAPQLPSTTVCGAQCDRSQEAAANGPKKPIPVQISVPFTVTDATGVVQGQVTFTKITVDPPCTTIYGKVDPPKGHYLGITSTVATSPDINFNGLGAPNGYDFDVIGSDGFTQTANTQTGTCYPDAQTYRVNTLQPNSKYQGVTLLDVPDTSGTLVFRPHFQTTLPGWAIAYTPSAPTTTSEPTTSEPTTAPTTTRAPPTTTRAPATTTRAPATTTQAPALKPNSTAGCAARAMAAGKFDPSCPEYQGYLDPGGPGRGPTSGDLQHQYGCQQGYIPRSQC